MTRLSLVAVALSLAASAAAYAQETPTERDAARAVVQKQMDLQRSLNVDAVVAKARELGASPSDIGDAIGITRQAVYNRLRHLELRAEIDPDFAIPDLRAEAQVETPGLGSNQDLR